MRSFRRCIFPLHELWQNIECSMCTGGPEFEPQSNHSFARSASRTPFRCYRDLIISSQSVPHFCFNSRTDNYLTLLILILSHVVACGAIRKPQNKSLMYASRLGRYLTWPALSRFPLWDRGCKRKSPPISQSQFLLQFVKLSFFGPQTQSGRYGCRTRQIEEFLC
jgi:hypothetical protein